MHKSLILLPILASWQPAVSLSDNSHHTTSATPDSHAPIGVMGDHLHKAGEWMFSYRFMRMEMEGNRQGSERISANSIVGSPSNPGDFMVAPTSMTMDMHMFGAMYASSNDITWMFMLPYLDNDMDHVTRMGGRFTTETSGIGDIRVSALYRLSTNSSHKWHANLGVSFPTGSIDEEDVTPMGKTVLPYPMQLGSGTYDLLPGVTYNGYSQHSTLSWGAQLSAEIRLSDNDENYSLGNEYQLTSWLASRFSPRISGSIRAIYSMRENIDGNDERLNPAVVQTARTDLQGFDMLELGVGINWVLPAKHRLAVEITAPVYRDLDGPQLERDTAFVVGWQYAL